MTESEPTGIKGVQRRIRIAALEQTLRGQPDLTQARLAELYSVSKTTIREDMRALGILKERQPRKKYVPTGTVSEWGVDEWISVMARRRTGTAGPESERWQPGKPLPTVNRLLPPGDRIGDALEQRTSPRGGRLGWDGDASSRWAKIKETEPWEPAFLIFSLKFRAMLPVRLQKPQEKLALRRKS
ncbi:MAG TPA: DeoR family transcriptional regulator [Candidatus Saccharimonadales bacterium]|nr:DeoR family transcriptional regulator [Candidatus Saccharimonadales bacterium]